jgi:hypothetical protein
MIHLLPGSRPGEFRADPEISVTGVAHGVTIGMKA